MNHVLDGSHMGTMTILGWNALQTWYSVLKSLIINVMKATVVALSKIFYSLMYNNNNNVPYVTDKNRNYNLDFYVIYFSLLLS